MNPIEKIDISFTRHANRLRSGNRVELSAQFLHRFANHRPDTIREVILTMFIAMIEMAKQDRTPFMCFAARDVSDGYTKSEMGDEEDTANRISDLVNVLLKDCGLARWYPGWVYLGDFEKNRNCKGCKPWARLRIRQLWLEWMLSQTDLLEERQHQLQDN